MQKPRHVAEKVIFDYIITTPGYPRRVEGRKLGCGTVRSRLFWPVCQLCGRIRVG